MRASGLAVVMLAIVGAACQSFDKLKADDPTVSEGEVHAAGHSGEPDLVPHLHHILSHRADYPTEVVVAALVAVGRRRDDSSIPCLARLARDADEEVRWHVALALKRIGGAEATDVLGRMARGDESELVRVEAAR